MNICTLPTEILDNIVSCITRPRDLKPLCLVSKYISEISTRHLYHEIHLNTERFGNGYWMYGLARDIKCITKSRGVKFVRRIRIDSYIKGPGLYSDIFIDYASVTLELLRLLGKLQDDCLERFEYDGLTVSELRFLWQHQKKLRNIKINHSYLDSELDAELELLKSVNDLVITIGRKKFHRPKIDLRRLLQLKIFFPRNQNTHMTVMNTYLSDTLMRLTHLTIMGLEIAANSKPLQVKSCPSLTNLAVIGYYSNKPNFLEIDNPALRHFSLAPGLIFDYQQAEWFPALVRPLRGLESLFLRTGSISYKTARELAAAIELRRDTLEFLLLSDVLKNEEGFTSFTNPCFFESVKSCQKITQLGLPLNADDLIRDCKDLIQKLPILVTLEIQVSPRSLYQEGKHVCTKLATRVAEEVMQACAPSSKFSLLVLCFWDMPMTRQDPKTHYRTQHLEDHRRQHFIRRDRAPIDVVGEVGAGDGPAAIRIDRKLARSIVPKSDVLDFHASFKY